MRYRGRPTGTVIRSLSPDSSAGRGLLPLLLLVSLLASGCTNLLWTSADWSNVPAANPNLRLYQGEQRKDLLVVYDEYAEYTKSIHVRAYWLYENQLRVEQSRRPHFTSVRSAQGLPVVSVFSESIPPETNALPRLYAVVSTNTESFMVYSNQQAVGSHDLPIYTDPVSKVERVALSPAAVTEDVALVAAAMYFLLIAPETDNWPR